MEANRRSALSRRDVARSAVVLGVVAIAALMLVPSVAAQPASSASTLALPASPLTSGAVSASATTPYVTGASILAHDDWLTLASPGSLNIYFLATDGSGPATGFSAGGLVSATDRDGHIAAAIADVQLHSDNYTTSDTHFSIGGVGVSGFQYYGEKTRVSIPPVQGTTTLTETLVLPESALVVVVGLGGGQSSLTLTGLSGLATDAAATGTYWSAIVAQGQLKGGTYTISETTTDNDNGVRNQADLVGVFAFSNSRAGFIDKGIIHVVATIVEGKRPIGVAYDSGKGEIFVTNYDCDLTNGCAYSNVSVISDVTNKVVATIPVGLGPCAAAYDSAKGEVFVANDFSNNVSVISDSTNKVVATIPVGDYPDDVAYDSGKGEVFVADSVVSVINDVTNKVVATVPVAGGPVDLAYDSGKGQVFVTTGADSLAVISDRTNKVVATIPVGSILSFPSGLAYDSAKGEVFVANLDWPAFPISSNLSVISDVTDTVVANIPVVGILNEVAYDSGSGELFLVNSVSDTGTVVSAATNTVVASIPLGDITDAVAYDSGKGEFFVVTWAYSYPFYSNVDVISDGTS